LELPELAGCRLVTLDPSDEAGISFRDLYIEPVQSWSDPESDDLVCILYTSGTTGMPKGCMINNGYLVHMPLAHAMNGWFTREDTSLCPLPLYHGFALSALMDALVVGCRVSFDPVFNASTLIARARAIGASQIFGVGAMAAALLRTPPAAGDTEHSVDRGIFIPLAPDVQVVLEERFHMRAICEGYGQTEVVPATMGSGEAAVWLGRSSAGKRVPWLDVQVVDEADRVLTPGETGEIVVRPLEPYSMFSGYWRKEQATLEAWRNLWHHTGDLGCFDVEGRLYFVDRKKDALRWRGENVSSLELERAIAGHPLVAQVAVHATPAGVREDDIKACLVLEPGAEVAPEELFEFFRENLPYYAVPRYVEFVGALPTNAVGRVQKHKLRAQWNTSDTIDLQELGLVVAREDRR
jgi:crotonobetaine/carnitine-CoA ligase